jgi:hypothetical protein
MTLLSQQWCDVGIAAGNDKADACAAANQTPAACNLPMIRIRVVENIQ